MIEIIVFVCVLVGVITAGECAKSFRNGRRMLQAGRCLHEVMARTKREAL